MRDGMHAASHAILNVLPAFMMCADSDMAVSLPTDVLLCPFDPPFDIPFDFPLISSLIFPLISLCFPFDFLAAMHVVECGARSQYSHRL